MAINTELSQFFRTSTNLVTTGSSILSLSSQVLKKTMMYIKGEKPERGIGGFLFDVTKETIVECRSDITDYPLEGDYQIQAHYSRHPVTISITGVCSDIRVHNPNDDWNLEKILDDATEMMEKINVISSNLGLGGMAKEGQRVASYMQTLHVLYRKIKETVNRINQMIKWFGGDFGNDDTTSQIKAYETLKTMWENGDVVTVETPWKKYENCVIENLTFTQPEDTTHQTEINVRLKQLTLVTVGVAAFKDIVDAKTAQQLIKQAKAQNSGKVAKGSFLEKMIRATGNKKLISTLDEVIAEDKK
mgnify:CR=1 FL=1